MGFARLKSMATSAYSLSDTFKNKLITRERVRNYSIAIIATNLLLLAVSCRQHPDYSMGGDFVAFYSAGEIFNTQPKDRLYDLEIQDQLYSSRAGKSSSPFAYTPWFVLPFAALARLPYIWAFAVWTVISIALLCTGFLISYRSMGLPMEWRWPGLFGALAFPPFQFFTLRGGHLSAVGFLILSVAFALHRQRRSLTAGLCLSLMTYKPTLLLIVFPMLICLRLWRVIVGLAIGSLVLSTLSLWLIGISGLESFIELMRLYVAAGNSASESFQTFKYVDIGAGLRLLLGRPVGIVRFALLAIALPLLWLKWRKLPSLCAWSLAVIATLLLNLYAPI